LFLAAAPSSSTNCTRVDQLRGIGRRMPVTMWCFTLAALSLIGIPPMAGFVSKWYLLTASLEAPIQAFGVAGLVVLVVSALLTAGYLLPVVTEGFFPGRDFITGAAGSGSPDDMAHDCLCRGCGADGSAARRPAALAGSSWRPGCSPDSGEAGEGRYVPVRHPRHCPFWFPSCWESRC
ncbi:MAG: proton-conducting transporter membrane subunit, partial [Dysosmobacter sp.]